MRIWFRRRCRAVGRYVFQSRAARKRIIPGTIVGVEVTLMIVFIIGAADTFSCRLRRKHVSCDFLLWLRRFRDDSGTILCTSVSLIVKGRLIRYDVACCKKAYGVGFDGGRDVLVE